MKLSLPTRIPLSYMASFNVGLLLLELLEGTPLWLALSAQAFLFVACVGFNLCGGLVYASGAFIFFSAVLTVGLGMVLKAVLVEPLQSNLLSPQKTMLIYLVGMCCIVAAAYFSTKLRRRTGLLESVNLSKQVAGTGLGCLLISIVTPLLLPDTVKATFNQFNIVFITVIIMLLVYQVTKESNGRRSYHPVVLLSWLYITGYYGLWNFSKQGIFAPTVAWAAAALAAGYRISFLRLLVVGAIAVMAAALLTPYSQIARVYADQQNGRKIALDLLMHPLRTREMYNEQSRLNYQIGGDYHWFNEPQGLLDRLTMAPIDDALIYSTDTLRPGTPYAIWTNVLNMIPRYFYPDKPLWMWGNLYAHDIGVIGEGDESTGISFSPYADAYHTAQWIGVALYMPIFIFVMFWVSDSVAGSAARSPWALVYVLYLAHAAPEGMLAMTTYTISNFTASVLGAALITRYIAPVLGNFLLPHRQLPDDAGLQPYNHLST